MAGTVGSGRHFASISGWELTDRDRKLTKTVSLVTKSRSLDTQKSHKTGKAHFLA
jgi:hypothetical protein